MHKGREIVATGKVDESLAEHICEILKDFPHDAPLFS